MPTLSPTRRVTGRRPGRSVPDRPIWPARTFVLAAAGSAVGLGNIWRFPYIAGEYGGGAFVLVYVAAVALIAVPLLATELMLGRRGRRNPVDAFAALARSAGASRVWQVPAWLAVATSFLVLAIYSVVAGWALAYVRYAAEGRFGGMSRGAAAELFARLLADPGAVIGWHLLFLLISAAVVAAGVRAGIERAARWLVPALVVLLAVLVAFAAAATGRLGEAAAFVFMPDFSRLDGAGVLAAMGHACYTLSLGIGAMVVYGSYAPPDLSVPRAAVAVAVLDTSVSILAALTIFPIVFAAGLRPGEGPGLAFVTLPLAFGSMPGGALFGVLFFLLLVLAALTSAISVLEPAVCLAQERLGLRRTMATGLVAALAALAGIVPALAFNEWAGVRFGGRGLFELLNGLANGVLMPLAAVGAAVFAAHVLPRRAARAELGISSRWYAAWRIVVGWAVPVVVLGLLALNLVR